MIAGNQDLETAERTWTEVLPIADLLIRSAALTPDRRAIVIGDDAFTYREVLERTRRVARGLTAIGVGRGDHVGILMLNGVEFVEAYFAAAYVGAVIVPLNPRYRARELRYALGDADIVVLMTTGFSGGYRDFPQIVEASAPGVASAEDATRLRIKGLPQLRSVVITGGPARPGFLHRTDLDRLANEVEPAAVEHRRQAVSAGDEALILYTSGTTSDPKGCVFTHEQIVRGPVNRARGRFRVAEHDVVWSATPLFHAGSMQQLLAMVGTGGTFASDVYFDPGRAIALVKRERPTVCWALFPAIMTPILDHPDFNDAVFADVRKMLLIGPAPLLRRVQQTFPHTELLTSCGMTEMSGVYALSAPDESPDDRAETQGQPLPGVDVRLVGSDGATDVESGAPGEVLVRGPGLFSRYYNDPVKTAASIDADGWLHTGDLYRQAPNGNLVFVSRVKDMLKIGGENVSALEIESFLIGHPDVAEVAVIGVPDARYDEVPVAFVELRAGVTLSAADIVDFCTDRISRYKVPREVVLVAAGEWPMSTTKIDKRALRAMHAASESAVPAGSAR